MNNNNNDSNRTETRRSLDPSNLRTNGFAGTVVDYGILLSNSFSLGVPSPRDTLVEEFDEVEEYIFDDCSFPFECLVFEGGGLKGMAYVGSLEV